MALMASILIPTDKPIVVASLGASTASSAQQPGSRLFAINADQDITIGFGSATKAPSAGASSYRIPANTEKIFDLGNGFDRFAVYNLATSAANIYILPLSKS